MVLGRVPDGDRSQIRLIGVLAQACDLGLISGRDRDLLLALAERTPADARGTRWGGLTSSASLAAVADLHEISPRTVRRWACEALTALRSAAGSLRLADGSVAA